ncbi:SEC-C metal-binding domain-containing protein [Nocardioides acrostichi]|uniref:SEC-C domain-containing protein n=1 Tax=Nocardioides acrostichi TaxID=2784339 RepID=A0A930V3G7_9ACTN|nr:SEC-C metal-binding domain-containing protein [Nocardioides acrostichi]MBF4163990.1 SEC-C domain-containing protein [Nocardioides acrostichi]
MPDAVAMAMITDGGGLGELVDGSTLVEAIPSLDADIVAERGIEVADGDEPLWLLDPTALAPSVPDCLVGITVVSGRFEILAVEEPEVPAELALRLRDIVVEHGGDGAVQIGALVWQACADDPDLFTRPAPPLSELIAAGDLVRAGEFVGPPGFDFARSRLESRARGIAARYDLDDDRALLVAMFAQAHAQFAAVIEAERLSDDNVPVIGPDPAAVRELLGELADPEVAELLAVEVLGATREGAAALGLMAETYEPQAPRGARANLRWLRGKALERLGSVLESEAHYEEALGLDSDCRMALFDLARIASDRGNAERGLSLLRRVGAAPDDGLVTLLESFRTAERTDIGRNDRCWCGSGRKYKVCHRGREVQPLEERAAWLYQKAAAFLHDGPWRLAALELAEIRAEHWSGADALWEALNDGLVGDAILFEGGAFAEFVEQRGVLLPADELLLAQRWLLAERSLHEVESVTPGSGFTARDVRTGDRSDVRERTASRSLEVGDLVCARVVPAGETTQVFGGFEPVALHQRDALIALLDADPEPKEVVAFLSARFAPPTLQNTSGDALVFCETTFAVGDPSALIAHLDATYGTGEDSDEGLRWHEFVVTQGMERVAATFTLDGAELLVDTNSERRHEQVLATLTSSVPELRMLDDSRRSAADMIAALDDAPDAAPAAAPPVPPEVAATMAQVMEQYERSWLDDSIPALGGVTPREAAADPTRRPDLIRLLDSFPDVDAGDLTRMSATRLRAALGL